nr:MAG TPA: hypothetical protein [Caudoviricetes sp.]DAN17079.1 MAG TPA: hypothetical protein [Caudoviricetes sp.]
MKKLKNKVLLHRPKFTILYLPRSFPLMKSIIS